MESVLRAAATAAGACAAIIIVGGVIATRHGIPLRPCDSISRIPLAVIIILHMRGVAPDNLPIDLIQVIGLQHDGRDDSLARRGLHPHLHDPEEQVEFRLDGGGVAFLVDGEGGARGGGVVDRPRGEVPGVAGLGGGEVEGVVGGEGGVGGAGAVEWVAGCPGLGESEGEEQRQEGVEEDGKGGRH